MDKNNPPFGPHDLAKSKSGPNKPDSQKQVIFYKSLPAPCPYLDNQTEEKLFTLLEGHDDDTALVSTLTAAGFRRGHDVLYRPACAACDACKPVRIRVNDFPFDHPSVRRILRKNDDLSWRLQDSFDNETEAYDLFKRYQDKRHTGGDMAHMTADEFMMMMTPQHDYTHMLCAYNGRHLVGVIIFDVLMDGVSAVYSFFDPTLTSRSLGKALVYALVTNLRTTPGTYVYLGYWIAGSKTMDYKGQFPALEILKDSVWLPKT